MKESQHNVPTESNDAPLQSAPESRLKPLSTELLQKWNESLVARSELGLFVNDSARGAKFDEVYSKQALLGEGGFALVFRCQHWHTGNTYAVKEVVNADYEKTGEDLKEEIDALKQLRDTPYIVKLLDVFIAPDRSHLIMEEMRGGDLLAKLHEREVFTESEARRISRRLLEAISFCHKKRIAHRDIKPENILLQDPTDDTRIKLADFGCAKRVDGTKCLHTLCGSLQYVAPELYLSSVEGYDERCDLWSAGVVIYILLGGYAPFDAPNNDLPEVICDGFFEFHPLYWMGISNAPKHLISSLLVVEPDRRASLEEALDSTWLRRRDKESMMKYIDAGLNGSSTNTFDAWVRLQNESSCGSDFSFAQELVDFSAASNNTERLAPESRESHDSVGSLDVDDL
ncbi:serine/threonine protein kinase [Nitzschia inconspicua]|uniref:Serine/threonine protein kinase n=1 Tax=Nitzschia inconspicua TaxID=303405 RepID=A0A9K3LVA1_9STRA|nr:serine/threonine protein kinase [Nitzschia inconspicua]